MRSTTPADVPGSENSRRRPSSAYRPATRDPRHRDELIERCMPLAHHLARRYQRGSDNLDDIAQVAALGLINAVDRFDAARGMAFWSFAVPTIAGDQTLLPRPRPTTVWGTGPFHIRDRTDLAPYV